jgi:hypothetical protein
MTSTSVAEPKKLLAAVVDHIVNWHYAWLRSEMPGLSGWLARVCQEGTTVLARYTD